MTLSEHPKSLARQFSLQFLFHLHYEHFQSLKDDIITDPKCIDQKLEEFLASLEYDLNREQIQFSRSLILGTLKHYKELKDKVANYSKKWRPEKMPKVDLTILLQSIYELTYLKDTPKAVLINDAIELGKMFGSEESGHFLNGVLDRIL